MVHENFFSLFRKKSLQRVFGSILVVLVLSGYVLAKGSVTWSESQGRVPKLKAGLSLQNSVEIP